MPEFETRIARPVA